MVCRSLGCGDCIAVIYEGPDETEGAEAKCSIELINLLNLELVESGCPCPPLPDELSTRLDEFLVEIGRSEPEPASVAKLQDVSFGGPTDELRASIEREGEDVVLRGISLDCCKIIRDDPRLATMDDEKAAADVMIREARALIESCRS